jgi:hypothetical protein
MLLHDGELRYIGDPQHAALEYLRLNFGDPQAVPALDGGEDAASLTAVADFNVRTVHARLRDANVEVGRPLELDAALEAVRDLERPAFVLNVVNEDGTVVFGVKRVLDRPVAAGERIRLDGRIDNPLAQGRYFLDCWVRNDPDRGPVAVQGMRLLQFVVYGTDAPLGLVSVDADLEPRLEE